MPDKPPETVTLTHVQVANRSDRWPCPVGTIFGWPRAPQETWCIWDGKEWLPFLSDEGQAVLTRLDEAQKSAD